MDEKILDAIIEEDDKREEAEKKAKLEEEKQKNDLVSILATQEGIRVLKRIIFGKCFANSNAYTSDIQATSFNLGRQSVGQELLEEIKQIDEEYVCNLIRTEKGE